MARTYTKKKFACYVVPGFKILDKADLDNLKANIQNGNYRNIGFITGRNAAKAAPKKVDDVYQHNSNALLTRPINQKGVYSVYQCFRENKDIEIIEKDGKKMGIDKATGKQIPPIIRKKIDSSGKQKINYFWPQSVKSVRYIGKIKLTPKNSKKK